MQPQEIVAVLNTSPDTVELLRTSLERAGFSVVTGMIHDIRDGRLDLDAFVRQHDPAVIVWDIAVPYERQWQFFNQIKESQTCGRCRFVLTTTNVREVTRVAGPQQNLHEIVGKPYDLAQVVRAVKETARERPTR
jgi:DNA-binding response OmpR family regulator